MTDAQSLYQQILDTQPRHFDALYLSGLIANQMRRFARALELFDQAVEVDARHAAAHCNRGLALQELGRRGAALASYDRAIAIKTDYTEAYCNRGNVLRDLKLPEAALASYDRAIALKPDCVQAYLNRGAVLIDLGNLDAALASCTRAIEIDAGSAEAHYNRGVVLQELRQWEAALASYERSTALKPDFVQAYSNAGLMHLELDRFEAALAKYEHALAIDPDYAPAHVNRGAVLMSLKRVKEALAHYSRAVEMRPDYAAAHYNRAIAWLMTGDLAGGWIDYEWRWKNPSGPVMQEKRDFAQPLWLGEDRIAGETVLLYAEQGLGDTLQFCRFAKSVADSGAKVVLEVQKPLVSVLANLAGASQVIARGDVLPEFDFQCPLMSLPLAFHTTLDTIPCPTAYLASDTGKAAHWRARLGKASQPRIGLVWSGSAIHVNDRHRSLWLADWVGHLPAGFQYVSLQKELRAADRETLASNPRILDFAGDFHDFSDTAALCDCLDLVISVDTSVAHLSAALGKSTWILLPFSADWRWFLDRDDSPWYSAVKLYRQAGIGDWNGVFERVRADLNRTFRRRTAAGGPPGSSRSARRPRRT